MVPFPPKVAIGKLVFPAIGKAAVAGGASAAGRGEASALTALTASVPLIATDSLVVTLDAAATLTVVLPEEPPATPVLAVTGSALGSVLWSVLFLLSSSFCFKCLWKISNQ